MFSMKRIIAAAGSAAALALPLLVFAQVTVDTTPFSGTITQVLNLFNVVVVPILIAIVVILLVISAFQFAFSAGDEEKRKTARDRIIWGLVGVVIIFSIYGIVRMLAVAFDSDTAAIPTLPPITLP